MARRFSTGTHIFLLNVDTLSYVKERSDEVIKNDLIITMSKLKQ